jgi:hypothetical protein
MHSSDSLHTASHVLHTLNSCSRNLAKRALNVPCQASSVARTASHACTQRVFVSDLFSGSTQLTGSACITPFLPLCNVSITTVLKRLGLRDRLNPSGVLKSANSIATEFAAAAAAAATSGTGNNTSVYCGATNRRAHSLLRYMNQVCVEHYTRLRGIAS